MSSMTRPVTQSIDTMRTMVKTIESVEPAITLTPPSSSSRRASMSEVWRETIRPEV